MELSAEDLEDIPVVIQNDQVLQCTIRFECKKSNTSEKLFHYFYLSDQQFNRKIVHQMEVHISVVSRMRVKP